MAVVHGVPGEWARVKGTICGLWPLFLSVFALGFSLAFSLGVSAFALIIFFALLIVCWCTLLKGMRHVERFYKGARGEEKVSSILQTLPETYHIFNDFKASSHHIDHVVVGPAGVFSIETKFWSDKVTIEQGHILVGGVLPSRSPIAQARKEALAVKTQLKKLGWDGGVSPILAFASNTFQNVQEEMQGVVIINSSKLKECFENAKTMIDPIQLQRILSLMENNQ
jgi:hypothetical protein